MKKLFAQLCLFFLVINSIAQAQIDTTSLLDSTQLDTNVVLQADSNPTPPLFFDLAKQIIPQSLTTVTAAPIEKVVPDTQRVIVYDTVQSVLTSNATDNTTPEKKSSILDKVLPKPKEKIPSISEIISFSNIFWSIIVLIITYFVIHFIVVIIERFAEKSTSYRIALKSLSPFVRIVGWTISLIFVVEGIFQPPNDTVLAFLASAGIAIGFAAQDILKNVFGGIMILFDRPFQVGDKIEVGEYYGEVKEIGLRSTRIVTKDDSLVSLPNAEVVNKAVSNSNAGEANCQVVAEIYLPIDTDTNRARQIATETAQVSRYIYLNKPISVLFINEVLEGRSYLKMRLKAYVFDIRNEFAFKSDMTEIVIKELIKQGTIKKEELM